MSNIPSSKTTPTPDELVLQLFAKVKEKQAEIAASDKPHWETSCTIGENANEVKDRINIQTVTDTKRLIEILGFLLSKQDQWKQACSILDLELPFKWMGYPVKLWQKDIAARVAQIQIGEKRKELETLEGRLNGLITVEQRRALELAEISKLLAQS